MKTINISTPNVDSRRVKLAISILKLLGYDVKNPVESFKAYQASKRLIPDGNVGNLTFAAMYEDLLHPRHVDFTGSYFVLETPKKQIVFHHTASSDNADGVVEWWKKDGVSHVATPIVVKDTETLNLYAEDYWAYHLGVTSAITKKYNAKWPGDKYAVGIEICNWGQLTKNAAGEFVTYANTKVAPENVVELDFRGFKYWEAYKDFEITAARNWALLMSLRFDIPLEYHEELMWKTNSSALNGVPGIYTHNSFREDKVDISPQPKIVEMLKSLQHFDD